MTQDAVGSYPPAGPYPQLCCFTRAKHFTRSNAALPVRSTFIARRAYALAFPEEATGEHRLDDDHQDR